MKKQLLFLSLSMILSLESFSQIIFEKGYFINDSNQKVECLIKNIDWQNNPAEFEYMLSNDSNVQKASVETVKEFGINGVFKYIRATVKIDRSSDQLNKMSSEKNPVFQEKQLFLKVLIEGKASLFLYEEEGYLTRLFYNVNESEINQLVYKRYLIDRKIAHNNYFRQQIFVDLKCQAIIRNDIEHLQCTKTELKRLFIKYNECTGFNYINYDLKQKKDLFNLSFRPGLNFNSLAIQNYKTDYGEIDFDNKSNFRFGIEAEFILPFNKNKWGIIVEPTYQYYKTEKTIESSSFSGGVRVSKVDYQAIELPLGVRHYFFFNDKSKIFVDISYIFNFNKNSFINFTRVDGSVLNSLEAKSETNIGFGLGYKYKDKYSLSMRYQTSREMLGQYLYWDSNYNTFSIIFGYSLF